MMSMIFPTDSIVEPLLLTGIIPKVVRTYFFANKMTFSLFSMWGAIVFSTVFALLASLLVRKAGWKTLPALFLCLVLIILRSLLPIEAIAPVFVYLPPFLSNIHFFLLYTQWHGLSLLELLLLVWAAGTVIFLGRLLWRLLRQVHALRQVQGTTNERLLRLYYTVCEEMRCKNGKLCVGEMLSTPMMAGFIRPNVLLPAVVTKMSDEEISCIFRHELSHFKRKDLWTKLLLNFVCCIFWWNPVMYILRKSAEQMQELRCDAYVCKDLNESQRQDYAEVLLEIARLAQGNRRFVAAGYFGRAGSRHLTQRFHEILGSKTSKVNSAVIWAITILMLLVFFGSYKLLILPQSQPKEEEGYSYEYSGVMDDMSYILRFSDGTLMLLNSEGKEIEMLTEADLEKEPYCNLRIFKVSVEYVGE